MVRQSQIGIKRHNGGGGRAVNLRSTDGNQQKSPAEALIVRGTENILANKKPQIRCLHICSSVPFRGKTKNEGGG